MWFHLKESFRDVFQWDPSFCFVKYNRQLQYLRIHIILYTTTRCITIYVSFMQMKLKDSHTVLWISQKSVIWWNQIDWLIHLLNGCGTKNIFPKCFCTKYFLFLEHCIIRTFIPHSNSNEDTIIYCFLVLFNERKKNLKSWL